MRGRDGAGAGGEDMEGGKGEEVLSRPRQLPCVHLSSSP